MRIPRSAASRKGPWAVPYREVARGPALQWVRTPSPSFSRLSPYSEMARHLAMSSSWMATAFRYRASSNSSRGSAGWASAAASISPTAQLRFTAVGREALRASPSSVSFRRNACRSSVQASRASRYMQ